MVALDWNTSILSKGSKKPFKYSNTFKLKPPKGKLIETELQAYQIQAGLSEPILEDTRALPWMNNQWTTTLQQFLQTIQCTIHLDNPWTIPKIQNQDCHLMEDFLTA